MAIVRRITVINTSTQDDKTLEFTENDAPVRTLGDLKAQLDRINMPHANMKFVEANTKSTYEDDDALLPTTIPFTAKDGSQQTTSDLVFVLTVQNKKIASGLSERSDVMQAIKALGLQALIKEITGKSYTNISTDILKDLLNEHQATAQQETPAVPAATTIEAVSEKRYSPLGEILRTITAALGNNNILNTEEVVKIYDLLETERQIVGPSPYTEAQKRYFISRATKTHPTYNNVDAYEECHGDVDACDEYYEDED